MLEIAITFCFAAVAAANTASLACEKGLAGLPGEFFEKLNFWQRSYNRDSLERSREFLYGIYERKLLPLLDEAVEQCPAPTLEIMMNSVLAAYIDISPFQAKSIYQQAIFFAQRERERPSVAEVLESWENDTVHTYPLIFGSQPQSCFGTSLKVYVYDPPQNLTAGALHCVLGQWGTEVLFHHFFLHANCRTESPEDADFFYVPVYTTCLTVNEPITHDDQASALIWDPLVQFLVGQQWFLRRKMSDHIFLFADGQSARVWDSYDLVRSESIFMMSESKCPTWDEPMRRYTDVKSCSSGWKDIIIPGHTDWARSRRMRLQNRPLEDRDILMTFHGRHPRNHNVYEQCTVRGKIMDLDGFDGVDVGDFVDDYHERKGRSRFCLVPGGTSPWTNQLYESFFCGCIPVILSDEYEVAFQHVLQWPRFSIKWPEAEVGPQLYDYLNSIPEARLREMKAEVDRQACWFDYFSESPDCSPYMAVLVALEERKSRYPAQRARFWGWPSPSGEEAPPQRTTRFHSLANESWVL
eukprot:TRINITY_DN14786_c0_g1_i1.p1 TRINITY_DN14786_c0_g1~~TRINITY_DN14786_c0_g1_i1.p1  ORF type:complete len:525 (+),score=78.07 TRINITY_DN14786_c0_g1_i1:124-1698(+)